MAGQQNIQTKRNLFAELAEGLDALKSERLGQVTLRTYSRELPQKKLRQQCMSIPMVRQTTVFSHR